MLFHRRSIAPLSRGLGLIGDGGFASPRSHATARIGQDLMHLVVGQVGSDRSVSRKKLVIFARRSFPFLLQVGTVCV